MFCFCKQKTAYEMRISDWSSDVCSSDLQADMLQEPRQVLELLHRRDQLLEVLELARRLRLLARLPHVGIAGFVEHCLGEVGMRYVLGMLPPAAEVLNDAGQAAARGGRSEEHTSELQSLMRISYAVFCLKKKTKLNITNY